MPTLKEAGFPDIDPQSWFGLFAPRGTPDALVEKIQQDVASVFADSDFRGQFIDRAGFTGVAASPAKFREFIMRDFEYKKRLIGMAGIKAE